MAIFTVPVDLSHRNHRSCISPYSHWNMTVLFQASWNIIYTQKYFKIRFVGASLVAQWLRICLLMQGTRVRALVWEDPTCRRATGPVSHNY